MAYNPNRILIQQTVIETIQILGIAHPELSYNRAKSRYGSIFVELVERGKLTPCRYGKGINGARYYSVADIITAIGEEEARAKLI